MSVFNAMDESLITPEMFYNIQDARKELVAMNNTFGFIGEPGVEEAYETIQTYLSTLAGKARSKAGDVNDAGEIVPRP